MRSRYRSLRIASYLAIVLLLLGAAMAIELRLSAVQRVVLDSIDDPVAQEQDEASPANAPSAHRGHEALARIALAVRLTDDVAPSVETAVAAPSREVSAARAPPSA